MSQIKIPNGGEVAETFFIVHHVGDDTEWRVTNIELWIDQPKPYLVGDDIRMDDLSEENQADIILALNEDAIRRRDRARRLERINQACRELGVA